MTDLSYIKNLLVILELHGVKHLKMQGLELEFHVEHSIVPRVVVPADDSTQIIAETLKKQEEAMPPDLRADALMDQDRILNWSSPDQKPIEEDIPMPLTGEDVL